MIQGVCGLLWLKIILEDLKIKWNELIRLYYNKYTINIAYNPVQHDRTKHIEIDKYLSEEKLHSGLIYTPYISIDRQLVDILTEGLSSTTFQASLSKLGMENIYWPTSRGAWKNEIRLVLAV